VLRWVKRLFGKAQEPVPSLEAGRLVTSARAVKRAASSRRPLPTTIDDLTLPETLAEAATHPREVNLRFDLGANHGAVPSSGAASDSASPNRSPEITEAQIEQIATRVADKLGAGVLGESLRETVRRVVTETSERLVREEVARVRAEFGRDYTLFPFIFCLLPVTFCLLPFAFCLS